jgi:hypothetical protein
MDGWRRLAAVVLMAAVGAAAVTACEPQNSLAPLPTASAAGSATGGAGGSGAGGSGAAVASGPAASPTVTTTGQRVHVAGTGGATSPEFTLAGTTEMQVSTCSSTGVIPFVWVYNDAGATIGLVAEQTYELKNLPNGKYYVTTSADPSCAWTIDFGPQ